MGEKKKKEGMVNYKRYTTPKNFIVYLRWLKNLINYKQQKLG